MACLWASTHVLIPLIPLWLFILLTQVCPYLPSAAVLGSPELDLPGVSLQWWDLLATLLLVQTRKLLSLFACGNVNGAGYLLYTKILRAFSAKLLSCCWVPSLCWCVRLLLSIWRALLFPLLNIMRFWLTHFSPFSRSLSIWTQVYDLIFL